MDSRKSAGLETDPACGWTTVSFQTSVEAPLVRPSSSRNGRNLAESAHTSLPAALRISESPGRSCLAGRELSGRSDRQRRFRPDNLRGGASPANYFANLMPHKHLDCAPIMCRSRRIFASSNRSTTGRNPPNSVIFLRRRNLNR